ncbi:hypothetical protein OH76DRAFT_1410218 [Lentinus brumalis]|uniref:Uncharacterized protein n=1 Tax=Lentinus brumalis TaxID=2498619 RepID=A0A371CSZ6_9APHY|nr:hypothetical protein OH76DRAFT_1410218 [Polyporus brumalis]
MLPPALWTCWGYALRRAMSISRYVAAVSSSYVDVSARSPAHVSQGINIKAGAAGPIVIPHSRPLRPSTPRQVRAVAPS